MILTNNSSKYHYDNVNVSDKSLKNLLQWT